LGVKLNPQLGKKLKGKIKRVWKRKPFFGGKEMLNWGLKENNPSQTLPNL